MASSASDPAPLIGITTYLEQAQTGVWDVPASFLPKVYLDAVTDAGGIALLLPPQPSSPEVAAAVIARLDGLIVSGGADVDPTLYGQASHPKTGAPRVDRDAWETDLLTAAADADLPYLGICRGAQVLNVARGGSLHQHLPDLVGDERYQPGAAQFGTEAVSVEPSTALGSLVGDGVDAQVYHHQAIDAVGEGLVVTARSADGIIEAIEDPAARFGVAVQWHPEEDAEDRRIFAGLIDAAKDFARQKQEH
ncbi:gamma-glutamyl-gamma-aminobutyrate hydrolase family protein [Galactobacter valiniphilus]|uniref:gamma-glutamyl-gamma-aminobutyrate hydrolase family protein n=1 Tax=Galactobacter valiniphilus TaxID=2676122 RepID=UPI0018F79C87|nr:gamma-glutamyl-gamma-aminobutyrate hydrolase family protein [Galactobacter valiniphilus]